MAETPPAPTPWWKQLLEQPIVQRLLLKLLAGGFGALALYVNSPLASRVARSLGEELDQDANQVQLSRPAPAELVDGGTP